MWDFGDGSLLGSGAITHHAYTATGTFTPTVIVTDNSGARTSTILPVISVTDSPPPPDRPTNDDFAAAVSLTGLVGQYQGSNVGATMEPGEPFLTGTVGDRTTWFEWTAETSGLVTITTQGSDFDTVLGVFTGSDVSRLTRIAANDDNGDRSSAVAFITSPGTTYHIAVGGYSGSFGSYILGWAHAGGDSWLDANILIDPSGTLQMSNFGATIEPNEPLPGGIHISNSVWSLLYVPANTTLRLSATAGFDTVLGLYRLNVVGLPQYVIHDDDSGGNRNPRLTYATGQSAELFLIQLATYGTTSTTDGNVTLTWNR